MQAPKTAPLWFYLIPATLIILNLYTILGTFTLLPEYAELDLPFSPMIRIGLALLWIIIFGVLTAGLVVDSRFAFAAVVPTFTAYGLANIIGTLLFARSEFARGQLGFQVITTVVVLLPIWWIAARRNWIGSYKRTKSDVDSDKSDG